MTKVVKCGGMDVDDEDKGGGDVEHRDDDGGWGLEADCCPLVTGQPQVNSPPAANITSHWIHIGIQAHTASMHVASHWNAGRSFIDTDIGK